MSKKMKYTRQELERAVEELRRSAEDVLRDFAFAVVELPRISRDGKGRPIYLRIGLDGWSARTWVLAYIRPNSFDIGRPQIVRAFVVRPGARGRVKGGMYLSDAGRGYVVEYASLIYRFKSTDRKSWKAFIKAAREAARMEKLPAYWNGKTQGDLYKLQRQPLPGYMEVKAA